MQLIFAHDYGNPFRRQFVQQVEVVTEMIKFDCPSSNGIHKALSNICKACPHYQIKLNDFYLQKIVRQNPYVSETKSQNIGLPSRSGDFRQLLDKVAQHYVVWTCCETLLPVIICMSEDYLVFHFSHFKYVVYRKSFIFYLTQNQNWSNSLKSLGVKQVKFRNPVKSSNFSVESKL